MNWKLVDKDGVEVVFPYECEDFRGEKTTVIGGRVPHKPGSSGFIYVDDGYYGRAKHPSVCNLKWENVDAIHTMNGRVVGGTTRRDEMKTSALIGPALDWAVAKGEGRVMREPVCAKYEDVKGLPIPFYLREVVCTYNDEVCVTAIVKDIKVIRCGVDASVGASAPSISFVDSDGVTCLGSIDMFFLSNAEAELEAQRALHGDTEDFSPSTDWSQGGPIIERESIDLMKVGVTQWRADCGPAVTGPTPLIAAMRAFVTKKFGVEIEIPEELK